MDIIHFSPIQSIQHAQGIQRAALGQSNAASAPQSSALRDTISFSEEALRLSDASKAEAGSTKIRFDLVNRIKAEIAAGSYDTSDKMDIAIDRMASRIF